MSFDISCHLTFHVILVILVIIEIIVTKVIMTLLLKVIIKDRCVFKKWVLRWIVIGQGIITYRAPSELITKFCKTSM